MKNKFLKNKSGTDKILSVYWFVILFIVAGAVVYMVSIFYGQPYDARSLEANILVNNVADCISDAGRIKAVVFEDKSFEENFLQKCHLNFNVEEFKDWDDDQYYVDLEISDFKNQNNVLKNIIVGNKNLPDFCKFGDSQKNLPYCLERKFYSLDGDNNQYIIKILAVVRKTEKNAA